MTTPHTALNLTLGDRYDAIAPVGRGAAAQVYRVRDRWSGSERAAKVLLPESVKSEQTLRRFEDEYRILRGLHHPGLPEVYDYGWVGEESRYMIMELVDGEPLDQYFQSHPEDVWVILYELCEVLSFIHDHSLLHQDIKPSNILVRRTTAFGEEMPLVTLLDFGLTFRRDGEQRKGMVGTPAYMSPEVIRRETPLTRAVDYYSLGATLFELLTGEVPFKGTTREVLGAHLEDIPHAGREKIEYAELYPFVYGLMSKDKNERMEVFGRVRRSLVTRLPESMGAFRREISVAIAGAACRIDKNESRLTAKPRAHAVTIVVGAEGTGKTAVAEQIIAEAAIAGRKIIDVLSFDSVADAEAARASAMRVWNDALGSRREQGALIYANLPQESAAGALIEALVERYDLLRTEEPSPGIEFVFGVTQRSIVDSLADMAPDVIELGPVGGEQRKAIVERLRPVAHPKDGRHLNRLLTESSVSIGRLQDALRFNIQQGNVRYEGGQWHAGARAVAPEQGDSAAQYYATTLNELDSVSSELARWVCCQEVAIPLSVLSRVSGVEVHEIRSLSAPAVDRGIVEMVEVEGEAAAKPTAPGVRLAIYSSLSHDDARRRHAALVAASGVREESGPSATRTLRFAGVQYASLGDLREMARCFLAAANNSQGDIDYRRDVLSECFQRLRATRSHQLIARYCVKLLCCDHVNHSDFVGARKVLEDYVESYGGEVPSSFLLIYVFSLFKCTDIEGMKRAVALRGSEKIARESEPGLRRCVCQALVARQDNRLEYALELVQPVFDARDRVSPALYANALVIAASCAANLGDIPRMERFTTEALVVCAANGFHDLYTITQSNWASVLVDAGRYREAMHAVAVAMKVAGRNRLFERQNDLFSTSSMIYYEMGKFDRALRWIGRARELAQTLGNRTRVVITTMQIGMNLQMIGHFEDAIRHARLAVGMIRPDVTEQTRTRAIIFLVDALRSAHHADTGDAHCAMMEMFPQMDRSNDSAYARLVDGHYLESIGATEEALESYRDARRLYEKIGFLDDKTRASIRIARILLEKREYTAFAELMGEIRENAARMESVNILGESSAVRILGGLALSDREELSVALEEARRVQPTDASVRLELSKVVALAGMELGKIEVVKEAASSFYADVRSVVARMDEQAAANYLHRSGANEFMAGYTEWSRSVEP